MSLEKLFQQIIESEQTSESRRDNITRVRRKVSQYETEIRAVEETCSAMRNKTKVMTRRLHDEQTERLVLLEQSRVLKDNKEQTKRSIQSLQCNLNDSRQQFYNKQSEFFKKIIPFCSTYDLTRDWCKRTKYEIKEDKSEFKERKRWLVKELGSLKANEKRISDILAQKVCFQVDISELHSQTEVEDKTNDEKQREFHDIAQKVTTAQCDAASDPELLGLQRELDCMNNYQLEKTVLDLKKELSSAKRNKAHKSSSDKFKFRKPKNLA